MKNTRYPLLESASLQLETQSSTTITAFEHSDYFDCNDGSNFGMKQNQMALHDQSKCSTDLETFEDVRLIG